jgi:hypothetical protein
MSLKMKMLDEGDQDDNEDVEDAVNDVYVNVSVCFSVCERERGTLYCH